MNSKAISIKFGSPEMVKAFQDGVEWYRPVFRGLKLKEEGGHSNISYYNLRLLIEKLGKPLHVERQINGNVLVHFKEGCYLATGFDCGYMGAGPYYFAKFGCDAGFGEEDVLYLQLTDMDREFVGVVWNLE